MKKRKLGKKLVLGKSTVANLMQNELRAVRGGYLETELMGGCTTWHPICFTKPVQQCQTQISVCRPCSFDC
jgi:hypothetical protein